eukprot:5685403-Pyramimonas_sp.AAC.1
MHWKAMPTRCHAWTLAFAPNGQQSSCRKDPRSTESAVTAAANGMWSSRNGNVLYALHTSSFRNRMCSTPVPPATNAWTVAARTSSVSCSMHSSAAAVELTPEAVRSSMARTFRDHRPSTTRQPSSAAKRGESTTPARSGGSGRQPAWPAPTSARVRSRKASATLASDGLAALTLSRI